MKQTWHDLLFMHWPMLPETIRPLVPQGLDLDLYQGQAYLAIAPFWMSGIRSRFLPPTPGLNRFPELNVRTYVRYKGNVPGVYFFSLDAGNRMAVYAARKAYGLPYFHAAMSVRSMGENYEYSSRRLKARPAEFRGRYRPISQPRRREQGSLEHFLTERYCLYAVRDERVSRAYIHHLPWPLQDAAAEIEVNTMAQASGIDLPAIRPLLHFSRELEVLVWWPERV